MTYALVGWEMSQTSVSLSRRYPVSCNIAARLSVAWNGVGELLIKWSKFWLNSVISMATIFELKVYFVY